MNTKTVKEILTKEDIKDAIKLAGKEIHEWERFLKKAKRRLKKMDKKDTKSQVNIHSEKDVNEIPETILDDDIANWEHDNLVENG